ncbi:MAG: GspH/FimT family pseudopilin [Rhodoferax sp.]
MKTPTSTTSPEGRYSRKHNPFKRPQRGFTLIELLVVLAIGAMLVGLVPSAFDRLHESSQYRDTVRAMVVDLRQARQQALAQGQVVLFRVNLADRQFGIEGQALKAVPTSLEIKTTVGNIALPDNSPQASIAFLPDGGSSGGTIELVRKSGAGVRIRVDWLFGQVTQEPRTP